MLLVCRQPSQVLYNTAWRDLRYFVPSSLTAFSMHVLRQTDNQVVLLGVFAPKTTAKFMLLDVFFEIL